MTTAAAYQLTPEGAKAEQIADWAWIDPAARAAAALDRVALITARTPQAEREIGDVVTMLTRLSGAAGPTAQQHANTITGQLLMSGWDESEHPRDPATGRFVSITSQAAAAPAVGGGDLPGGYPDDLPDDVIEGIIGILAQAGLGGMPDEVPAVGLANEAPVDPQAMQAPGLPVPDDRTAVTLFTAHRIDGTMDHLAHAAGRLQAARKAAGPLRDYHTTHVARHLQAALGDAYGLTANIRDHYPAESAELEQVRQTVGLAQSVSPSTRTATTAHLLETTLHELTHGDRHARAMLAGTPDPEWEFDADHCERHLQGAVEHAGKLREHFTDNYPAEAAHLAQIAEVSGAGGGGGQHARYARTAGMAGGGGRLDLARVGDDATEILCRLIDLTAIGGHHVPGTAYTFRHGWIPIIGKSLDDKYPGWMAERDKEAKAAEADGKKDARHAVIPIAGERKLSAADRELILKHQQLQARINRSVANQQNPALPSIAHAGQRASDDRTAAMTQAEYGAVPPAKPGTVGAKLRAEEPDIAALAAPGVSMAMLKSYIDARVAAEVARQVGQISQPQQEHLKGELAKLHKSQQALIAHVRQHWNDDAEDDNGDLRKHTIANTLFSLGGVGVAVGAIALGLGPVATAVAAGVIPLVNIIHDYARNLG